MVNFQSMNYETYSRLYGDKTVVLYGAGQFLSLFLDTQKERVWFLKDVQYIIDNSPEKKDKKYKINNRYLSVISLADFLEFGLPVNDYVIMLTISTENTMQVLRALDATNELNGAAVLYGERARMWGIDVQPQPERTASIPDPRGEHSIPKVIHYCWFGHGSMSELNIRCIESWKKHCPDYTIQLWNEDNYDCNSVPEYVKQAYDCGKYAFVSDYVRLDALNRFGGIYLDTDVMLLKPIDNLLRYKAVFGYMTYNEIATGLGCISEAGNPALAEMMDMYHEIDFYEGENGYNIIPCPRYTTDYFRRQGVSINNSTKLLDDDTLLLSSSFLCPLEPVLCADGKWEMALFDLRDESLSIHLCDNTWKEEDSKAAFAEKKQALRDINERLLADWKNRGRE